jgi:hypothetical protein
VDTNHHRQQLICILQNAYSGEWAAAYAYRGHWKSLNNPVERERIRQIENEEWVHREKVGLMLESLKAAPVKIREIKMWIIGRSVGVACHLIGWFLPMYFAGRLESGNADEYRSAALHAGHLGLSEFEAELLVMARVEREHEAYFMSVVAGHPRLPLMQSIFKWEMPAPVEPQEAAAKPSPQSVN